MAMEQGDSPDLSEVDSSEPGELKTGKVKWFNNAKGYGFILPDDGGEDLFAHYSSVEMDGYKTLKAGQDVTFGLSEGPKGMHAIHIRAPLATVRDGANESASDTAEQLQPPAAPDDTILKTTDATAARHLAEETEA